MKKNPVYLILMLFVLAGCIEPYNAKTDSIDSILVVEGIITGETTQITLSKSVGLDESLAGEENMDKFAVNHAVVYVECEDGAKSAETYSSGGGKYLIETGELNPDKKYRLAIHLEGEEYHSSFVAPAVSPPVEVSFTCDASLIHVCVTTYGHENQPGYYLWSFKEDWEITATMYGDYASINGRLVFNNLDSPNNRYYCWKKDSSMNLILGTTEKLIENTIREKRIHSFRRTDDRSSFLYRVIVQQNTIHKEAYDFFNNLKKNIEQTGSIFGAIPSEIMGNIRCVSNPAIPVIGYVDVSSSASDEQYLNNIYYHSVTLSGNIRDCEASILENPDLESLFGYILYRSTKEIKADPDNEDEIDVIIGDGSGDDYYIPVRCVDCTKNGGSKRKPKNWDNDHQ